MIDGLRSYPETKPSGLPWLGNVPAHWDVLRSKYAFREIDRRSATGEETHLSMSQRLGLVPASQVEKSLVSESYIGGKLVEKNDLVLNRLKAHLGVFARAQQSGLISPDYTVLRPAARANVRFFEFVLKSAACRGELRTRAKGIVEGFWRLYTDDFYEIRVPVPPLDEQRLIVRFLDWHGAQVARLVRAKRNLIALLNEQKQAIIRRAVTHGIDPDVKLKPSGVPWLGDVPEGWEVRRLRTVSQSITSGSRGWSQYAADQGPLFVRIANLSRTGLHLRFDDVVRLALPDAELGEAARTRTTAGDLLLSITAFIGSVAIVPDDAGDAYVSQHVARCRLVPEVNPRWIGYVLLSPVGQTHGTLSMNGGTKQGLSLDDVKNYVVLLPPREMQNDLADWIDQATRKISDSISAVEAEIGLIQEFRTRLIADVVTGKLDVRAAAAGLPEELEVAAGDAEMLGDVEDLADESADDDVSEEAA
jgi:type I restriction enzyme S subunit